MNAPLRTSLTLAAALAVLAAAPARADGERWEDHGRAVPPPAPAYLPAPAPAPPPRYGPVAYPAAPAPEPAWVAPVPARPAAWFARADFQALRAEYARLDAARARFYATWHGNPWRRDRFEAWYASRRAELDARWAELAAYRRPQRHGNGYGPYGRG